MTHETAGMPLSLFNSLTRATEPFRPIDAQAVRMYSCGPTVYDHAHLGNLRAYVFTDTLRRMLNWKGFPVNHVINITDVGHLTSDADEGDDKVEASARRLHQDIWALAAGYTKAFKTDLEHLNILAPTIWATATDHIQDMIAFARTLEAGGYTYELDSGLYFDTSRVNGYGYLARSLAGDRLEGARVEAMAGKRNPGDFAVWRRSALPGLRQMEWLSPWGRGAPGWHLECSVMSIKYLGFEFDIHTGGIDHREIHHCNEIAQNQAYVRSDGSGATFWMHNNFLIDRTGKMSKSTGGFKTLSSLLGLGVHPLAYRLMCLSTHYRSELEFSYPGMMAGLTRYKRMLQRVDAMREIPECRQWRGVIEEVTFTRGASFSYQREIIESGLGVRARTLLDEVDQAISEDLQTPRILPILELALDDAQIPTRDKLGLVATLDLLLGLGLLSHSRADTSLRPEGSPLSVEQVESLLDQRRSARAGKDFGKADALRAQLQEVGVEVMDGQIPDWEWVPAL